MDSSIERYLKLLDDLVKKSYGFCIEYAKKYPIPPDQRLDLRLALFSIPFSSLMSYKIALTLENTVLSKNQWWKDSIPTIEESAIPTFRREYEAVILQGHFVRVFSNIEWVMRNMLAVVRPGACHNGLGQFTSVYESLFSEIGAKHLVELFQIASSLRNCIHNNGHYCRPNAADSPKWMYRDAPVQFFYGKLIQGATELSFQLLDDLLTACDQIVKAPSIASLSEMKFVHGENENGPIA